MNTLPTKITILIDTREQKPIFQAKIVKDKTIAAYEVDTINAGDYTIKEIPGLVVIERKADGKELYNNFVSYRDRFYREVDRLCEQYQHKYIVICQSYAEFLDPNNWRPFSIKRAIQGMAIVESSLLSLQVKHNIYFHFVDEFYASKFAKRILVKHFDWYKNEHKRKTVSEKL